jgi:hypothetical protein
VAKVTQVQYSQTEEHGDTVISEGNGTCRLQRKSLKEYNKNRWWTEWVTYLNPTIGQPFPSMGFHGFILGKRHIVFPFKILKYFLPHLPPPLKGTFLIENQSLTPD